MSGARLRENWQRLTMPSSFAAEKADLCGTFTEIDVRDDAQTVTLPARKWPHRPYYLKSSVLQRCTCTPRVWEHDGLDGDRLEHPLFVRSVGDVDVIRAMMRHEGIAQDTVKGWRWLSATEGSSAFTDVLSPRQEARPPSPAQYPHATRASGLLALSGGSRAGWSGRSLQMSSFLIERT